MLRNVLHPDDREMELFDHLAELRARMVRAIIYIIIGMILAWNVHDPVLHQVVTPLLEERNVNITWAFTHVLEPFMLRIQVALVGGIALAFPFVMLELWGFVAPGLTRNERRGVYLVAPLSIILFFFGAACGWLVLKPSLGYFLSFLNQGTFSPGLIQNPNRYLLFVVKLVLAFGICFQLPVVLMFFASTGLLTSRMMMQYWRHAVVTLAVVGAVATPSNDPLTMMMMAAPLIVLYAGSIGLVKLVERWRAGRSILREDDRSVGVGEARAAFPAVMLLVAAALILLVGGGGIAYLRMMDRSRPMAATPAPVNSPATGGNSVAPTAPR
jgi:sec-independent protein translocase protein TatC